MRKAGPRWSEFVGLAVSPDDGEAIHQPPETSGQISADDQVRDTPRSERAAPKEASDD